MTTTHPEAEAPLASIVPAVMLLVAGLSTASLSGALLKLMSSELNIAMMTAGRYTGYLLVLMPLAAAGRDVRRQDADKWPRGVNPVARPFADRVCGT